MRNYYLITAIVGLLFMGCTVDNDDLNYSDDNVNSINLETEICEASVYTFFDSGLELGNVAITNSNDGAIAYVKFTAATGFSISEVRIMKVENLSEIPQSNGGIIPGKLDQYNYSSAPEANFEFPFENSFILAARVTFKDSNGQSYSSWVGDETKDGWRNGSTYLTYNVCIPPADPVCNISAGSDKTFSLSKEFILSNFNSHVTFSRYLLGRLDSGVSEQGIFNPSIGDLRDSFVLNPFQTYTTTYTVFGDDCSDSMVFTITVTP